MTGFFSDLGGNQNGGGGGGGFLDALSDPKVMALLGMAKGLGQAGMPSRMPVPMGAAFGTGASGAMEGVNSAQQGKAENMKIAALDMENKLKKMQLAGMEELNGTGSGSPTMGLADLLSGQRGPNPKPGDQLAAASGVPDGGGGEAPPVTGATGPGLSPGVISRSAPTATAAAVNPLGDVGALTAQYQRLSKAAALGVPGAGQAATQILSLIQKNAERGQFVAETRKIDGRDIQGQTDRLSGKWAPLDPTMNRVTVNNEMKMPPQETQIDKYFGDLYTRLQDSATGADNEISNYRRLDALGDAVDTGKFTGTTTNLKALAKGAGMDLEKWGIADNVAPAQAMNAMSREMALQLRNPAGGAGMPGAMSDKDREFLESMVPGLDTDPEGRKLILDYRIRMAQRSKDVAKLARKYRKDNGTIDDGFLDDLSKWSGEHPIFSDADAKKVEALRGKETPPASSGTATDPAAVEAEMRRRGLLK